MWKAIMDSVVLKRLESTAPDIIQDKVRMLHTMHWVLN
jgi:hypothetical protein